MLWFKHDANANADSKLQNVLLDYGLEGYGLYWYCIELITGKVDVNNITFQLEHDARIIARNTGSTPQKVDEMMRYFVKIGLFENSNGIITCMKIAKRLDQSMTSNKAMREIIERIKSGNHDGVMTASCQSHAVVMQEEIRRDKKRIETHGESDDSSKQQAREVMDYQAIVDSYHELLPAMPEIRDLTDSRKAKIRTFWKKFKFNPERWRQYLCYIAANCQWMSEDRPRAGGGFWKRKNLDYLVTERCYLAVREGRSTDMEQN